MGVELLAALFGFIFVSALVIYIFTRAPSARLVEQRLGAMGPSSATHAMESEGLLRRNTGTFPVLRRLLANSSWADSSALSLQQAGLALKVSEYVLIRLSFAAFAAVIVLLLIGLTPFGVILGAIVSFVASLLPAFYLSNRRGRRIQ